MQLKSGSIVTDLLQGKLVTMVTCLKCKIVSRITDPFQDLSLTIPVVSLANARGRGAKKEPARCALYDCLDSFTATDNLFGKIRQCDHCNSKEDATKRMMLHTLPNLLCIVLKRFSWTARSRAKINTFVEYPLKNLDMKKYVDPDALNEVDSTVYDLESVVMHHGIGLQSGHYTAYCFNESTENWENFNDSRVTVVDEEKVVSEDAYILFYHKKPPENDLIKKWNQKMQEAELKASDEMEVK